MSSSMLEQAVIDAQALKEAAVKNAEQEVLEKYSGEIKEAVTSLLEQEDPLAMDPMAVDPMAMDPMGMGGGGAAMFVDPLAEPPDAKAHDEISKDLPLKALDGLGINEMKEGDEIDLDLDALVKSVAFGNEEEQPEPSRTELMFEASESDLHNLLELEVSDEPAPAVDEPEEPGPWSANQRYKLMVATGMSPEDAKEAIKVVSGVSGGEETTTSPGVRYEESLDEDSISQAIDEILKVDLENVPRGMLGTTHPTGLEQRYAVDIAAAAAQDTARKEENEEFEKALKQIVNLEEHVKSLKSSKNRLVKEHKELKSVARQISNKLSEINTANAKLVYQNRILKSDSLNERQKDKLVEAVSNANSIEEAKVIYETLQDSLSSKGARAPQNLNEAVSKNSRLILKSNNKETQVSDSASERMKRLAGII